jgi:DNA-binding MarR family transcriptional regulator
MRQAAKIISALTKIQERSSLLRHGPEDVFDGVNLAEVHCIDWIGRLEDANVTKVADKMGMTRGAISKINKRLLGKGLVGSYQRSGNNKEIYYRLTEQGQRVYAEHRKCHGKAKRGKMGILAAYDDKEQAVILSFLDKLNELYGNKPAEHAADEPCGLLRPRVHGHGEEAT